MSLLRNRLFFILWLAQTISALGNPFSAIATAWLVYDLTGSKLALGGLLMANALPLAALRLVAGPLVDRWDRRRLMVTADLIRAAVLLLPVLAIWAGRLQIWHLFVVSAVNGAAEAFFGPATFAVVPRLVSRDRLVEANSLLNTSLQGSVLIGPVLAGVAVARWGAPWAMVIDAITFVVSALSLLLLPPQTAAAGRGRSFFREVGEAFAFFRRLPALLWLLALAAIANLFTGVAMATALPFAREVLAVGVVGYSMLQPAVGVGFLAGGMLGLAIKHWPRRLTMLSAHMLGGVALGILSMARHLPTALGLLMVWGLGVAVWNTFSGALYQQLVPDELRGRVQSVRLLVAQGSLPVGMAVGGSLAQWLGIPAVFLSGGLVVVLSGALALATPNVRKVDLLLEENPA